MRRLITRGPALPVGLALLAFGPALWGSFVADDYSMLHTVDGLDGPLSAFVRNDLGESGGGHFYRPLWVLLNAAIVAVAGEAPAAFHTVNVLLFGIVTAQAWWLLNRLCGALPALVGAAAFAVYPRHAESVAWISGTTDLLAGVFVLGALMALLSDRTPRARLVAAAVLTILGALTKEVAFVTPALAFVLLSAGPAERRAERVRTSLVLAAVLVPLALVRIAVIDGLGGNTEDTVGPLRIAGSAVTYVLGAITPHELALLARPYLLVIPLGLLIALAWALRRAEQERRDLALAGLAVFGLALVPALAEPMDLNSASGERLLLIPSFGLALTVAALIRAGRVVAVAAPLLLALCLAGGLNWERAGTLADHTVAQAAGLVPPGGSLLLLSTPDSYRNAHVFPNSLDRAVQRRRGDETAVAVCAPVQVHSIASGSVGFGAPEAGVYTGRAGGDAHFDFPVLGSRGLSRPGCTVARVPGSKERVGLERRAAVTPAPANPPPTLAFFDGGRVRPLP